MKAEIEKALNLANMLLGIGILLLIVPIGFGIITYMTASGQSPFQAMNSIGWICLIIVSLVPLGLATFIGGLTWMTYLRKKLRSEEIAEDALPDTPENS
ncbi:MAG: hypothetical protein AAF558_13500 [Verrucomicrobiota bacterium]